MSYYFDGASYASVASTPLSADTSFTMFAWFKTPNTGVSGYIAHLAANPATLIDSYYFRPNGDDIFAVVNSGTGQDASTTENYMTDNAWCCGAARYTVGASNTCTQVSAWGYNQATGNETALVSTATSKVISPAVAHTVVGTAITNEFTGYIAHFAIWNKELSEAELDALKTALPSSVASGNLIAYWPFQDDLVDDIGGRILSATGTVTQSADNPILTSGTSGVAQKAFYYRMLRNA